MTTDEISRKTIEQLAHSVAWFEEKYDGTCTMRPLLVHPTEQLAENASAPSRTRVITRSRLVTLRGNLLMYVTALASDSWTDVRAVASLLEVHHLSSGQFEVAYSVPPVR